MQNILKSTPSEGVHSKGRLTKTDTSSNHVHFFSLYFSNNVGTSLDLATCYTRTDCVPLAQRLLRCEVRGTACHD